MPNLLLEIGCEEIPARFMPAMLEDLKLKAKEKLARERLSYSDIKTLGTCRRLVLLVEKLEAKQADLAEEVKGPPAEIALAVEKFAASQGVAVKELTIKQLGPKTYVFARVLRKGLPAEKVLQKLLPEIIASLYQPLSMRWGSGDFKFVRPIHWITAQCGNKVVKFELAGVKSSKRTSKLKTGVIIDQDERRKAIRQQVEKLAKKHGLKAYIPPDLLEEVNYLVENPIAYAGKFDPAFLNIPQEILITSMKKNQKYFPLVDANNKLQAKFVVVSDGCRNPKIIDGNQKVLSARLSDAKFFFEEDKKQPLRMRLPELEQVGFFKGLGTMAQKTQRLQKLSHWLGKHLKLDERQIASAEKIALLCKADLNTKMVYEFPELQGVMGREYALLSGEDKIVANGIFEHYLPRFSDDILPASKEGMVVALADKIDSIVGCFSIGEIPTGSQDPYGLRRAAAGIIRIITENKLDLLLDESICFSHKLYEPLLKVPTDPRHILRQILEFIAARIKPVLLEKEVRYDVVDAVLSSYNDILDVFEKASSINQMLNHPAFPGVVLSADRIWRIAKETPRENIIETDFVQEEEKKLYEIYMKVNWEVGEAVNKEKWGEAVVALAQLTSPLEIFFDKVMVMHKQENLKLNRLALLKAIEKVYLRVADFKKVVLS